MTKLAHGIIFTDPAGNELKRTMEAFVDDTDLAVNDAGQVLNPQELTTTLQTDAQHWEKLLFTSGRKLELTKCFFYLMYWKFSDDGIPSLISKESLTYKLMLHPSR
jgi:hypothetical protein